MVPIKKEEIEVKEILDFLKVFGRDSFDMGYVLLNGSNVNTSPAIGKILTIPLRTLKNIPTYSASGTI